MLRRFAASRPAAGGPRLAALLDEPAEPLGVELVGVSASRYPPASDWITSCPSDLRSR